MEVIQRKCAPFVVDFPVFGGNYKVATFNKYLSDDVKRHISYKITDKLNLHDQSSINSKQISIDNVNSDRVLSAISDKCVIGKKTEIGANT